MQKRHVIWAKWGAAAAFVAGVDAMLGIGAIETLAALCLSDGSTANASMPSMPMDHSRHSLPWLIAGFALAATAVFGAWRLELAAARLPWAPRRRAVLAALVQVAQQSPHTGPDAVAAAWNLHIFPPIRQQDARIAFSRFSGMTTAERRKMLDSVTDREDRADLIQSSLEILQLQGDNPAKGLEMLEHITEDMRMSGLEICAHWESMHQQDQTEKLAGSASAMLGPLLRDLKAAAQEVATGLGAPIDRAGNRIGAAAATGLARASRIFVSAFAATDADWPQRMAQMARRAFRPVVRLTMPRMTVLIQRRT